MLSERMMMGSAGQERAAWLNGWSKRIKITISNTNINSELSDFPVLVYLSSSSGIGSKDVTAVFDELTSDANRKKITVTSSDGETELYVEIERWDDANEKASLWVKVPTVSSSAGTDLYLYFDVDQADNTTYVGDTGDTPAKNVWDSDFVGVWHMAQDPTGGANCILDSTSYARHGTPYGSMTSDDLIDGLPGKALDFDNGDDHLQALNIGELNNTDWTVESSQNFADTGVDAICHHGDYTASDNQGFSIRVRNDVSGGIQLNWYYTDPAGWYNVYSDSNVTVGDGTLAVVHDKSTPEAIFYIDGAADPAEPMSTTIVASSFPFRIAAVKSAAVQNFWDGAISELRISKVVRPAAWIKATHHSNIDGLVAFEL